MTNQEATSPATEDTAASNGVATKLFKARYNFKTAKLNSPAAETLGELVKADKLTSDDLEQIKDGDTIVGHKRKSFEKEFEVVNLAALIPEDSLTSAQINHIQFLIEKGIEGANKEVVDDCGVDYKSWSAVLSASPTARKASAKVTAEMVGEATKALIDYLINNTKATEGALNLVERLANKKFSVSACNKVKPDILERIQGMIGDFVESLEGEGKLGDHEAVIGVWANELEKTLDPEEEEITADMFG